MQMTTGSKSIPLTGLSQRITATVVATTAAVVIPQLFHLVGLATGTGSQVGQTWLPMFLPVIVVGLLAGPEVGAIVGITSPVIAFTVTGMPVPALMPFMIIQLVMAGVVAGLLSSKRLHIAWSTVIVVASGPVALLIARLISALITGTELLTAINIWLAQMATGVPGLLLQLVAVGISLRLIRRSR